MQHAHAWHILLQVRIVDKHVRGGRLYCKKGRVVDVHPGAKADVCVDDTGDTLTVRLVLWSYVCSAHQPQHLPFSACTLC